MLKTRNTSALLAKMPTDWPRSLLPRIVEMGTARMNTAGE